MTPIQAVTASGQTAIEYALGVALSCGYFAWPVAGDGVTRGSMTTVSSFGIKAPRGCRCAVGVRPDRARQTGSDRTAQTIAM